MEAAHYPSSYSMRGPSVEITEVRITLKNEDKLKAFANITFNNEFVVRGLKVISGSQGYFVSMPSRRKKDGSFQDMAHPITNDLRKKIEDRVLDAFESELNRPKAASPVVAEIDTMLVKELQD